MQTVTQSVIDQIDAARDELVDLAVELVRIPTVNPPGENYRECAEFIGARLQSYGFEVDYPTADHMPEHSARYPRINVFGKRRGRSSHPSLHLNGHFDVVPVGENWTVDPFTGLIKDGRLYGRGSADMKAGLAAAMFAAEAIRRAGVELAGNLTISGTVDEESGGFAGMAWLAEKGLVASTNTDYVIIPEPFSPDRVCIGHRGVYWFKVTAQGRIGHGCMPFLGVNAIEHTGVLLEAFRKKLAPALAQRKTTMPVVPPEARFSTLNINAIQGGQANEAIQTPCVADKCEVIFDRRFLPEESFEDVRNEIAGIIGQIAESDPDRSYELEDLMVVQPVRTSLDSALVHAFHSSIKNITGIPATLVASPGTYDHKHATLIGGIEQCVAYGPGVLEQAHQPDEWCSIEDLISSTKVLASVILDLIGGS